MSLSLYKTCRACLDLCEEHKSFNDTIKFEEEVIEIANIVEACVGLKVEQCDTLPDTLCLNCTNALRKAYEFRKQFIASDYFLKNNIEINQLMNEDLTVNNDVDLLENDDYLKHDNNEHFMENDDFLDNDDNDDLFKLEDDDIDSSYETEVKEDHLTKFDSRRVETKKNVEVSGEQQSSSQNQRRYKKPKQSKTLVSDKDVGSSDEVPDYLFQFKETKKELQDFICNICGKAIRCMPSTFKHHLKLHDPSKCIKCDFCGKLFPGRGQLKIHRMIHTGEKPFACTLCPYSARLAETLNKHMKMHTGEKSFKCDHPDCDYVARYRTNLAHHKNVKHGNYEVECVVCHRVFRTERFLKRHMQIHQPGENHECDICHKTFSQKDYVAKHKRKVHKIRRRLAVLPILNNAGGGN